MEILISSNIVTIKGNMKSISDFQVIKQNIDDVIVNNKSLIINIVDSLSITSSIIGYLNKLVLKDSIDIHMSIGDEQLLHLLDDLNLVSTFKAKKA
ncbi:MAG: hypothetical protein L3J10_04120 [Sulfurimonas sp.]|nr:hypothetical protein [Sulfurimonas sp.]